MPRLVPKHSLPLRVSHWINVPILAVMTWSGLLIYWAYDPYRIEVGGVVLFKFFPDWVYQTFRLERSLALGMAYHFAFAWLFALNGAFYVAYTLWSGHWRELLPGPRTPLDAFQVVLHDLGVRKEPLPPGKFNAAQKLAYTGIIVMGAGSLVTGLAILKPTQLAWLASLLGGYQSARLLHFALTVGYAIFIVIHVSQVIKAGWNNFRAMVAGYEVEPEKDHGGQ
ncbi:MAG: cytochrome b/b6 domain-containing protein [Gemmataceae bacterium]